MLTVRRRYKGTVSPFIHGSNVWDIPEKHWTFEVQHAIRSAYNLGIKHTLAHLDNKLFKMDDMKISIFDKWEEDEDE